MPTLSHAYWDCNRISLPTIVGHIVNHILHVSKDHCFTQLGNERAQCLLPIVLYLFLFSVEYGTKMLKNHFQDHSCIMYKNLKNYTEDNNLPIFFVLKMVSAYYLCSTISLYHESKQYEPRSDCSLRAV